jgi:hypothetical protein
MVGVGGWDGMRFDNETLEFDFLFDPMVELYTLFEHHTQNLWIHLSHEGIDPQALVMSHGKCYAFLSVDLGFRPKFCNLVGDLQVVLDKKCDRRQLVFFRDEHPFRISTSRLLRNSLFHSSPHHLLIIIDCHSLIFQGKRHGLGRPIFVDDENKSAYAIILY